MSQKIQMGWPNRPGRFREAMAITRDIQKICQRLQAVRFRTDLGWTQSGSVPDAADKTCQRCGIQDWVALRIHSDQPALSRRDANTELASGPGIGMPASNEQALWGTPRKCALFGSDSQNSISSGSDVPECEYSEVAQSSRSPQNDDRAGTRFPSDKLDKVRPSAAICKVMSVPDSRCVWVVTPDDHVNIGFHEILIHDLADEEWPLVTLSDLRCLRLEWQKICSHLCLVISLNVIKG